MMLLLTGCNLLNRTGPTDKDKGELVSPIEAQIHKGTEGLRMEFVQGQPPINTWENTDFPITVRIQNEGAYDIQRGALAITGELYFISDEPLYFDLEGKSQFNPEGGFSFEKFSATSGTVEEDKTDSFYVVACYDYETDASATICINPRVMETDNKIERGECITGIVTVGGGQGAPVAVTSIEQEILPIGQDMLRMNLKIHVSNLGRGKVVSKEQDAYMKECTGQTPDQKDSGKIRVDNIQFSNYRLGNTEAAINCPNLKENMITLNNGQFTIECYADMDTEIIGSVAFTTPLLVEMSYGYTQISTSKSIKIKNTLEESY